MTKDETLRQTISAMLQGDKGFLAMDESTGNCNKRFAHLDIPQTVDARRAYRELLVETPGLEKHISSAILCDETMKQAVRSGTSMPDVLRKKGIIVGAKVDQGTVALAGFKGDKITEGLDGLRERLGEYFHLGARFAKWRSVITIGSTIPSGSCIRSNMQDLARYAALCQEASMVPIVEPEVLMDGKHSMQRCYNTTNKVLIRLFTELRKQNVNLEEIILKANMVLPGKDSEDQNSVEEVADATIKCFLDAVPACVPGIAFLSGGQDAELASARLNAMHVRFGSRLPWRLTFSYSRALQEPALKAWSGSEANTGRAQEALLHRAECNTAANRGEYRKEMEKKKKHA